MVSTITCAAAPTVPVSSAISTTGATVSWTASAVGGGAGAISYTLEVYTDVGYTTHVSGSPFSMGTSLSQALTGLTVANFVACHKTKCGIFNLNQRNNNYKFNWI
jgi:hypothetical protein